MIPDEAQQAVDSLSEEVHELVETGKQQFSQHISNGQTYIAYSDDLQDILSGSVQILKDKLLALQSQSLPFNADETQKPTPTYVSMESCLQGQGWILYGAQTCQFSHQQT